MRMIFLCLVFIRGAIIFLEHTGSDEKLDSDFLSDSGDIKWSRRERRKERARMVKNWRPTDESIWIE